MSKSSYFDETATMRAVDLVATGVSWSAEVTVFALPFAFVFASLRGFFTDRTLDRATLVGLAN